MGDASVLLWVMRFPLPFLLASDESAMNCEGLGLLFSRHLLFFAALTFHELRGYRNEMPPSEDRKRKNRIFEPSRAFDTPLTTLMKIP
jgi:hypothetical protein